MTLHDKAWSPYAAGILIGLLQVPAYLLIEAALGTASSYVTIGAHIASLADASIGTMEYLAKHMYGAKNLWQVALVIGIAIGAFISMTCRAPAAKLSRLSGGGPSASTSCRAAHRWRSRAVSSWSWERASPTDALWGTTFPAWPSSQEPGAIVSQMQLRTFLMVKVFLTAVATGLIVLAVLNGVWGVKMHPKALVWQADIVGGLCSGPASRTTRRVTMTANIGTIDRFARIVIGLALIATAPGLFGPPYQSVWAWIGIIPLVTGVVGWRPLYSVLGIRTCKTPQAG